VSGDAEILRGLFEQTLAGEARQVRALTAEGLRLGLPAVTLLDQALLPALQEVGRRFERREFFVPEMLVAARAMQEGLALLRPLLAGTGAKPVGTMVMATVRGDLHDIGKNLCNIMLEGAGFRVIDLGTNVPTDAVVAAVREHAPALVGLSAFLTTTMPMFRVTLDALSRAGLRDRVRVLVGGAPVTAEFAEQVGADGYAPDAGSTVRLALRLLERAGQGLGGAATQGALRG
jgi:5-methyltetrahydrofolate--homocysteine methyltransferase